MPIQGNSVSLDVNYVIIDAAGNVALLMRAPTFRSAAYAQYVRHAVVSCTGAARIDIVAFINEIDGKVMASFWNPDGTPEKMCGNACRSVALAMQIWEGTNYAPASFSVSTELCQTRVSLHSDGTTSVELPSHSITLSSESGTDDLLIDVGTPHAVRRVDALFSEHVNIEGERLSTASMPVNATFCKVMPTEILARTFERGVGETKSCGTGAIAAAIALEKWGAIDHLPQQRTVRFVSGQVLSVAYNADRSSVSVSGSCHVVASGVFTLRPTDEAIQLIENIVTDSLPICSYLKAVAPGARSAKSTPDSTFTPP